MKIAIPSNESDLGGRVAAKVGNASRLFLVETDDMSFEVMDCPQKDSGPGSGIVVLSLAVDAGAEVMLVGYVAPHIANTVQKQGLKIITNVSGTIREAVADFMVSGPSEETASSPSSSTAKEAWSDAVHKGGRQVYAILPRLAGVILLLGLFRSFVDQEDLLSFFSGAPLLDSLLGAFLGGLLVGNPVNSYVIGDSLLKAGISLSGVLALMLAWVTVGLIQFPAEAKALGMRFAVARNAASFLSAVVLSYAAGRIWGGGL